MEVNFKEGSNGDTTYNLTGLQAFTEYVVALQCVAEESVFWSGWSQEKMGTTEEEGKLVPCNSFSVCSGLGGVGLAFVGFVIYSWESWTPSIPEPRESTFPLQGHSLHPSEPTGDTGPPLMVIVTLAAFCPKGKRLHL